MVDLPADIEQQLANLTDGEWSALTARVRAPDSAEALRTVAGKVLSGAALDSFVSYADVSKFTSADGTVDEQKVIGHLTAAFGVQQGAGGKQQWGRPGASGRAAAAKRFGQRVDPDAEAVAGVGDTRGAAGRAAAAKRFGTKKES